MFLAAADPTCETEISSASLAGRQDKRPRKSSCQVPAKLAVVSKPFALTAIVLHCPAAVRKGCTVLWQLTLQPFLLSCLLACLALNLAQSHFGHGC